MTMKPARIRVRIRSLKLDDLSFAEQCDRWRQAMKIDDRLRSTQHFANWALANVDALKSSIKNK